MDGEQTFAKVNTESTTAVIHYSINLLYDSKNLYCTAKYSY